MRPDALKEALRVEGLLLDKIKMRQDNDQKLDKHYFLKLLNFIGVSVRNI